MIQIIQLTIFYVVIQINYNKSNQLVLDQIS